jgi:hypothetical protein
MPMGPGRSFLRFPQLAGWCRNERRGREFQCLVIGYRLGTVQGGIVFVGADEVFHFLRHSRQLPGRNQEYEADEFALWRLSEFGRSMDRPTD